MRSAELSKRSAPATWTVTDLSTESRQLSPPILYFVHTNALKAMTTDSTFAFSRNQELLEEVSQFQMQILNQMMQFSSVDNTEGLVADEIQSYKVYDV